jgi:hypothetical protein
MKQKLDEIKQQFDELAPGIKELIEDFRKKKYIEIHAAAAQVETEARKAGDMLIQVWGERIGSFDQRLRDNFTALDYLYCELEDLKEKRKKDFMKLRKKCWVSRIFKSKERKIKKAC